MCCKHGNQSQKSRRGLSRMDLIVVLCVTGTVISLLIVAFGKQRREHFRRSYLNSLKRMALAIHNYHGAYRRLPPAFDKAPPFKGAHDDPKPLKLAASMHVHLLPFLEQDDLYKKCMQQEKVVDDAVVELFLGRAEEHEAGVQHFAANLRVFSDKGVNTAFDRAIFRLADIEPCTGSLPRTFTDGTSNTIAFATKYARCGDGGSRYAATPNSPFAAFFGETPARTSANAFSKDVTFQLAPSERDCLCSPLLAQSFSELGIAVALADGAVRMLSSAISPRTWNAAMQPNDGNPLGDDW